MTKLLILVPTPLEYNDIFANEETTALCNESNLKTAICGIGPAASAFFTGQACADFSPDKVLLCGIAGAFAEATDLTPGQLVSVGQETFADLGFMREGQPINFDEIDMPLFPVEEGQNLGCTYKLQALPPLPTVSSITVSCVTSDLERANYLANRYDAHIENMEGAAVALACSYLGIPLIEIRSISNTVGVRDKNKWCIPEALKALNSALPQIIATILN